MKNTRAKAIKTIITIINNKQFEKLNNEDIKKYIRYSMTLNHTGKMDGMSSVSTSCKDNTICQARAKDKKSICAKCYAQKQLSYQHTTAQKMHTNYLFYTSVELRPEHIPFLNFAYLREEAFGDIQNILQFKNYCLILEHNKHIKAGVLWSKNGHIIRDALKNGVIKPDNMKIILSSPYVNKSYSIEDLQQLDYMFFTDAVFTVYDPEYVTENNIVINCGSRECATCLQCYSLQAGKITFINELLK